MNPTNATSPSQVCMEVWYGYKGSNDKSIRSLPNVSGSACATVLCTGGGTGSVAGGGSGSTSSTVGGGTSET